MTGAVGRPVAACSAACMKSLIESLALIESETMSPSLLVWSAGTVMTTGLFTFQLNVCAVL